VFVDFLSEIVAITGEHFVTMKELVVINADMDKLNILLDCHKINAYRILYIAAVFDPLPDNKPHSDEYTTLQKTALGMFVNSRFKSVNEWVENNKDFDAVDSLIQKKRHR
jgi:hypothetical protein